VEIDGPLSKDGHGAAPSRQGSWVGPLAQVMLTADACHKGCVRATLVVWRWVLGGLRRCSVCHRSECAPSSSVVIFEPVARVPCGSSIPVHCGWFSASPVP
jgi:hypothetical protein